MKMKEKSLLSTVYIISQDEILTLTFTIKSDSQLVNSSNHNKDGKNEIFEIGNKRELNY